MSVRDPRSPDSRLPSEGAGNARDPTQSLSLPPEDASHPSLALGTHGSGDEHTKVESPGARAKPAPAPVAKASRPPPVPRGTHADEPDRVGHVLGTYRILELLGRGGMGYVFRAEHTKLGREVALKLLRSDYAKRRDAVLRFFQEAKTVNRVRHRNIVDVTDFVELSDGTTFIIMEFLRGQSLGKWSRSGVDLPRALAVLLQICDGLGAAHEVGVVHRDLKPDNIIVVPTSDGAELVKLLDFGVAKLLNRDDEDVGFQTAAGSVIGTPAYMSPEQAGGMAVDARSDIYSLGAIMYELFCGQPMFRGRSFGEYVRKHLTEMPVPPRATAGGATLDPRLEATILKCLEKEPSQRFETIHALRDALLGLLGGMETLPPGFAMLTGPAPRPTVTLLPPEATAAPAPHAPGLAGTAVPHAPLPPAMATVYPGPYPGLGGGYSQIVPPTVAGPPPTPWWVWFVGGALAVGLGIGAAVWYAGRDARDGGPTVDGRTQPSVGPVATAIEPARDPAAPMNEPARVQSIELRFDSNPSGGVYEEGKSAERCRTPCAFSIQHRAGVDDRRVFVVRSEGYRDHVVPVDLALAQREFNVQLEPRERAPGGAAEPGERGPRLRGAKGGKKPKVRATEPATSKDGEPAAASRPAERPKKPEKGIDATETLDPFRKK